MCACVCVCVCACVCVCMCVKSSTGISRVQFARLCSGPLVLWADLMVFNRFRNKTKKENTRDKTKAYITHSYLTRAKN